MSGFFFTWNFGNFHADFPFSALRKMRKMWNEKNLWLEITFLVHKKHICMILTQTKVTGRSSFHFEKIEILILWGIFLKSMVFKLRFRFKIDRKVVILLLNNIAKRIATQDTFPERAECNFKRLIFNFENFWIWSC